MLCELVQTDKLNEQIKTFMSFIRVTYKLLIKIILIKFTKKRGGRSRNKSFKGKFEKSLANLIY